VTARLLQVPGAYTATRLRCFAFESARHTVHISRDWPTFAQDRGAARQRSFALQIEMCKGFDLEYGCVILQILLCSINEVVKLENGLRPPDVLV
jgi:hypothetical protein